MKKHPYLLAAGMGLAAALLGAVIVMFLAASGSFSSSWLSAVGVLVIGAVLGAYHLGDGRYPIPRETKIRYSALCAAIGALSGWMNFTVAKMTWGSVATTKHGVQSVNSALEMTLMGLLIGGAICYYGLGRLEEP